MSNLESSEEQQFERAGKGRVRLAVAITLAAMLGTLVVCGVTAEYYQNMPKLPERNSPAEQSYTLNFQDTYYDRVKTVKEQTDDPETIRRIDALVEQPIAEWLLNDSNETFRTLQETLNRSEADHTVPVFVAYDIPNRDLGGHSAGGEADAQAYSEWIERVSETIAGNDAIVILEPDAVAQLPDMNDVAARERVTILADALDTFQANQNTAVYLDIGNSAWLTPEEVAEYMKHIADQAESDIQGVSLNVSNFRPEHETRQYALAVQKAYGQQLYIMIDNSRNGAAAAMKPKDWCNPAEQRLGSADHTYDPTSPVEVTFIKAPGESDGKCGTSSLGAGAFDSTLLLLQLKAE